MTSTKDILCHYFLNGACRNGSSCKFSHDRSKGKVDNVCRYYLKGTCSYGKNCRYFHDKSRIKMFTNESSKPQKASPSSSLQKITHPSTGTCTTAPSFKSENNENPVMGSNATFEKKAWENVASVSYKPYIPLCPFAQKSVCTDENCAYIHGDICDTCQMPRLHPYDQQEREKHHKECWEETKKIIQLEKSQGKICGICLEIIQVDLSPRKRNFGILSNCSHVFCLRCIRKWRKTSEYENGVRRSCPECRVHSHFVIPSQLWVSDEDEKAKLVENYKAYLSTIPCQYFQQGQGVCPFYGSCFYKHEYANGDKPEFRHLINEDGEYKTSDGRVMLSEFFDFRDQVDETCDDYVYFFDENGEEFRFSYDAIFE